MTESAPDVTIYTVPDCPDCEAVKTLLRRRGLIRIPLNSCTVGKAPPVHPYRGIRIFSSSHPLGLNLKRPDSIGIRMSPTVKNVRGDPAALAEMQRRADGVRIAPVTIIGEQVFHGPFDEQRPRLLAALERQGTR